jgi:uncharacterized protein YndB with AHSA1/START domain
MMSDEAVAEVRRRFFAAPEKVFSAFSQAHLVSRWLSPSPEIALTVLHFDFRVDGVYRFAYHVPGGQTMIVNGVYRSIDPPSIRGDGHDHAGRRRRRTSHSPPEAHASRRGRAPCRGLARCSRSTDHTDQDGVLTPVQSEENPK